ncbi:MAG: hypothetical protein WD267_10160 [Balneolales bacterium]
MPSVTYRKKGDRWHIRLRKKGEKERTITLPGTISEREIRKIRDKKAEEWEMGTDPVKTISRICIWRC